MAEQNELEIVLKLVDEASEKLKKITGDVKKDTQDISKESDKASKSIRDGMKEAGKGIKEFRREMFAATIIIASIIAVTKEWANRNWETKQSLDSLTISFKKVQSEIGKILSPLLIILKDLLGGISVTLKGLGIVLSPILINLVASLSTLVTLISNFIKYLFSGINVFDAFKKAAIDANNAHDEMLKRLSAMTKENISQTDELKNKLTDMQKALEQVNLMYLTGAISAQQYYDLITSNEVANFQNIQTRMQLTQQLAAQENLINNQSLMDYSTNVQARMNLLKTFQDYHHTLYASMMDFANMTIQKFSTGMTTALTSIIMGTKKASDAFKEFGMAMVTAIVEFVVQYGIQMLVAAALSKMIMASTIAQASAIAMAWYPAALYASIATMGAASATGLAALSAATGIGIAGEAMRIAVSKPASELTGGGGYAEGGWVGLHGPEIALVGERGPEYVVPNNRLNQMSGNQTSIHIEINNPSVRSYDDIDTLTEEISKRISHEIERIS